MLQLRIKKQYLDLIKKGKKTSEFRSFSDFYITRIFDIENKELVPKKFSKIKLYLGNVEDSEYVICEINGIFVNQYFDNIPEGMERGDKEIEIELGRILESR